MANRTIYIFQIASDISEGRQNKLYWISDIGSCNPNNARYFQKCPEGNRIEWAYFRGKRYGDGTGRFSATGDDWLWDRTFRIDCG